MRIAWLTSIGSVGEQLAVELAPLLPSGNELEVWLPERLGRAAAHPQPAVRFRRDPRTLRRLAEHDVLVYALTPEARLAERLTRLRSEFPGVLLLPAPPREDDALLLLLGEALGAVVVRLADEQRVRRLWAGPVLRLDLEADDPRAGARAAHLLTAFLASAAGGAGTLRLSDRAGRELALMGVDPALPVLGRVAREISALRGPS